jgi:transglutaminase/protease-like cytokinesis protein 3
MKKFKAGIYALLIIFVLSGCSIKYETKSGDTGNTVSQNTTDNSSKSDNKSSDSTNSTTPTHKGKKLPKGLTASQGKVAVDPTVKVVKESTDTTDIPVDYTVKDYDGYYNAVYETLNNFNSTANIKVTNYSAATYNINIVFAVLKDHFDADYGINSGSESLYVSSTGDKILHIEFDYKFSKKQMISMRDAAALKASEIVKSVIKPGMTDEEKELTLHDYLVNNNKYDFVNYVNGTLPGESYTDYGALVLGTSVCGGYAKAYYRLLNLAGIKNIIIQGYGDGVLHAWNLVYIDGKYLHVDTTWDDPISNDNLLTHDYFNLTDAQISKDHTWIRKDYPASN